MSLFDNNIIKNKALKFLVIDDQRNARKTIRNMLNVIGYANISEAGDGNIAIDKLTTGLCDFIICDWNMPIVAGIDVLKSTKSNRETNHIPYTDIDNAFAVIKRIVKTVDSTDYTVKGKSVKVTISAGVTGVIGKDTIETVVERADKLLYLAKSDGKNKAVHKSNI